MVGDHDNAVARAIVAVTQQGVSIRQAARDNKVPKSTLWRRLSKLKQYSTPASSETPKEAPVSEESQETTGELV